METWVHVLSEEERQQVHERSLKLLAQDGVRVDSREGRRLLGEAGAQVEQDSTLVRFPRGLVEQALALAPRSFSLGGRDPQVELRMNAGECYLCADGGGVMILEAASGERRAGDFADWLLGTRLVDALDEIDVYWSMVEPEQVRQNSREFVSYWRKLFRHCSKHIQDSTQSVEETRWLLEVLQVVFGSREEVRRRHPISFTLCPFSPRVIEAGYTDAYLAAVGWDIPVVIMTMPLMGMTSPASLIATIVQGNCEALAALCLVQAAAPGTPVIYAPALSVIEPHSGRYTGGAVEHGLLGAAVTEMARYYGLPAEACTGGSDHHLPGIQAALERAINWVLPALAWPDILVGPGMFSGSTVFSPEQLLLDIEVFRRCKRLSQGIESTPEHWMDEVLGQVPPGGNFIGHRSTRRAMRSGEWYLGGYGFHGSYEQYLEAGKPDVMDEMRQHIQQLLAGHQGLALDETVEAELERIESRARSTGRERR
jgi:trimethylamine--corrinoid protein Co-methyltransferase